MTHAHPHQNMIALVLFAYDPPPFHEPPEQIFSVEDVLIDTGTPNVLLRTNNDYHPIIGMNAEGWMMVAGVGWRLFNTLDETTAMSIWHICNRSQARILEDRGGFLEALRQYANAQHALYRYPCILDNGPRRKGWAI
ncbi:hypothetical protein ACG74X_19395 [Marivita sp. S0852]|uniref:hypothetical protein n=1 Tax=Marivita sp. S0852 TaxID=3373893 RepID=UPI00398203AD